MKDIFPGLKLWEPFCIGTEIVIIASIVNAYNLIDGSDGLTALLSLIGALAYGFLFYLDGQYFESAMAIAMAGALIGFIFYNLPPACVFMGDACSTFLGLAFGYFTFKYLNGANLFPAMSVGNRSIIAFSIVSVPVLDLIRLFAFRLIKGKNPFKGDVNHIHHLLLQSGFSKMQVVVILSSIQLFFIFAAYMLMKSPISVFILFSIIWYVGLVLFVNMYFIPRRKREKQLNLNS